MKAIVPFLVLIGLVLTAYFGTAAAGLDYVFGVVIPYVAVSVFLVGFLFKVNGWMKSAVPFNITTTAGQQKSLPWIKNQEFEAPSGTMGVIGRMLLEVLLFRSLFRNTRSTNMDGKLVHDSSKWLWTFAFLFHWSFLIIVIRHLRFFSESVPMPVAMIDMMDSLLQVGVPSLYLTNPLILGGLGMLLARRLVLPKVRYFSFAADFFPLFLILGIVLTGVGMRYLAHVDIMRIKTLTMSLVTFSPVVPEGIEPAFYVHLFLVSVLFMYFPFSKLMHMGGIWLSPTRNMANNTRAVRHVNPWNYEVKIHTYEAYEDEFRDKMIEVGLPVEKTEGGAKKDG